MGYSLGIDVGAATCAAAIQSDAALEPCLLGEHGATMPAVALPRADGTTLVGEAADRHSPYEPTLVARMVTSRLDEPGPMVIDGAPHDPVLLTEALVGTVIDRSTPASGAAPEHVVLTYPLRDGDAPRALLAEAAGRVTGAAVITVPEPVAAVAKVARDRDVGDDTIVAVVDFGGSTVDVTLVHRSPEAFDLVGDPASMDDFGGVDVDATMLALVEGAIGDVTSTVDPDDRNAMIALRRLRNACRAAKETLSTDDAAVVEVALPHARGRVEVTREALEDAIEPRVAEAADLVLATIDAAGLIPADLGLVLLTGGSARIPLVEQLVAERTGLPVVVDDAPELTTSLGAALFAAPADAGASAPAAGPPTPLAGRDPDLAAAAPMLGALPPSLYDTGPGGPGAGPGAPGELVPPPAPNLLATGRHGPVDTGPTPVGPEAPPTLFDTGGHGPVLTGPADVPPPPVPFDTGPAAFDEPPPTTPFDTGPAAAGTPPAGPFDTGGQPLVDTGAHPTVAGADPTGWPTTEGAPDDAPDGDPWEDDPEPGWQDGNQWDDGRTSVFDPVPPPDAAPTDDDVEPEWGQPAAEEFQRLRTSDTDPFVGRGASLSARLRERREGWEGEDGDDAPPLDLRLVVGGVIAAVVVVAVGGYALIAGTDSSDDPAIAVAETSATTGSTTAEPSTTTTTEASTTTESTTTTTEATTTTPPTRPRPTTTTTAEPAPPPPPPPPPPTPPTTRRPTTTTTAPTTTTTSSTITTTTTTEPT